MWPNAEPSPLLFLVLGAYAVMSGATFIAYGLDKSAAHRGRRRRVRENTLHLLALLGGWPGALLAIPIFRHKWRKASFVTMVWLIALAHVAAWLWWTTR
jgi:uncharacterized membrane protein YsdA (DUF1294 family)